MGLLHIDFFSPNLLNKVAAFRTCKGDIKDRCSARDMKARENDKHFFYTELKCLDLSFIHRFKLLQKVGNLVNWQFFFFNIIEPLISQLKYPIAYF